MGRHKRILVAGGAGFLGSNLCKALLTLNSEVVCLDNLSTSREENLIFLKKNKYFKFIQHDITQPIEVEVDEIYNLACPASPPRYQADAIQTLKTSVLGSLNLLELAKKLRCKILQASTSEVYGDPLVHPQKESYWGHVNPVGKRSCYDEGKRCAETFFMEYHLRYGLEIKIIRIFNTYGPGMDIYDGRVISNFIVQALKGEPLTVYGNGEQTRSFCYVDDMINAILKIMDTEPNVIGPINVGNPDPYSINRLAEKIIYMTNSESKIAFKDLPSDDPLQRCPDITYIKEIVGWEPTTSLEEGLKRTIEYFKSCL